MNEETKKDIIAISKKIHNLIQDEIMEIRMVDKKYEFTVQQIVREIDRHINDAVELVEDYKQQKLTLNQLEAEGGLRALIQLRNEINDCIL